MIPISKYKLILLFLLAGLIYSSCTDIMDPDISNKTVVLLSPADSLESILSTQTFWWEEVEFAEEYVLQIAKPDFSYIERLILDTVITDNHFTFGLTPSEYEWRVQARNTRSETDFFTHLLTIDSTLNISVEILQLRNPVTNDTTNLQQIIFKWIKLYNADSYDFDLEFDGSIVHSQNTTKDTINLAMIWGDGAYVWNLKAKNEFTETAWFQRGFFMDTEVPKDPALIEPADNATMNDEEITFKWTHDLTDSSSIKDSLIIIKNEAVPEIKVALLTSETMYADSLGPGSYTWYVRSVDKAGNQSDKSVERTLTIQ